jgi:hypothetical protein
LSDSTYHTVVPQSTVVVFHEATNGLFAGKMPPMLRRRGMTGIGQVLYGIDRNVWICMDKASGLTGLEAPIVTG